MCNKLMYNSEIQLKPKFFSRLSIVVQRTSMVSANSGLTLIRLLLWLGKVYHIHQREKYVHPPCLILIAFVFFLAFMKPLLRMQWMTNQGVVIHCILLLKLLYSTAYNGCSTAFDELVEQIMSHHVLNYSLCYTLDALQMLCYQKN